MFSGIVAGRGNVAEINDSAAGKLLRIDMGDIVKGLEEDDSVAVNGVCLTATKVSGNQVEFDVMGETLRKTTLGKLDNKSEVNLERSLKMGDGIEGHLVQGHVQGVGEIIERQDKADDFILTIKPPAELLAYIADKGSIAVNGVSLTVAELKDESFSVALIPKTLELTNLGSLEVGGEVNIETDMMARQMVRWMETRG